MLEALCLTGRRVLTMYRTLNSGLPQHETVLCCCHLGRTSAGYGRPTKPELAGAPTYHLRLLRYYV